MKLLGLHPHSKPFLVAVEKPPGQPTTSGDSPAETAVEAFRESVLPQLKLSASERATCLELPDFGLIYRLDNQTSGVLLFALNQETYQGLRERWASKSQGKSQDKSGDKSGDRSARETGIVKYYRCIVEPDHPELPACPSKGLYFHWMGHSAKSARKMHSLTRPQCGPPDDAELGRLTQAALKDAHLSRIRGRPLLAWTSLTETSTIARPPGTAGFRQDWTLQLLTGHRHQLRVFAAASGYPIVGDPIYGRGGNHPNLMPGDQARLFLHCWKISIDSHQGGPSFEAPLPTDWPGGRPRVS